MHTRLSAILLTFLTLLFLVTLATTALAQNTAPPEFRGLWVDTWGSPGPYDPDSVTTLVDTAAAANYNAIVLEVRKCGDAYYNSAYEPWARNIVVTDPPYDPLADCLEKAHAKGIEVHAWIIPYRVWNTAWPLPPENHVFRTHPEWLHKAANGTNLVGTYWELDPGVPGVQQYICDLLKDILSKYDVDGVNFDRIRYPESSYWPKGYTANPWGYNDITCERFRREYGSYPPTKTSDPLWATWCDFRRNQVTDLVRKCYAECVYIKPSIKMSADTIGWMGADPNVDFRATRAYTEVFQDHKRWMEEHILDMNILMNYKREHDSNQARDYRLWTSYLINNKFGRHVVDGVAAYLNSINGTISQIGYARTAGCEGVCTYSYRSTNKDNQPNSAFYQAIKDSVFALPAPLPDMPWKSNPTEGILFGQVTDSSMPNDPVYGNWICKAQVSISGPISKSMLTDGTGTFVFVDLPPGEYTVNVSSLGFKTATKTAVVTAGLATRLDFSLDLVDPVTLWEARELPDGTQIRVIGKSVTSPTGAIEGCIYIEEPNRTAGLKVKPLFWTSPVAEGDVVSYVGVLTTENGERVLDKARLLSKEAGTPLGALAVKIKDLDLKPITTGLLIQCTGKVVESGNGWFVINDGSSMVKVICPGKSIPTTVARVTGISGMDAGETAPVRVIRVRYQSDIQSSESLVSLTSPQEAIRKGFNLIGVPCAPENSAPDVVFAGLEIIDKLCSWNGDSWIPYNPWDDGKFGILRGEGYGLTSIKTEKISYVGFNNEGAADMRITLPKSGWNLISQPFTAPSRYQDMTITDGKQLLTIQEAVKAGWIMPLLFTWDNATQRLGHVWLKSNGKNQTELVMPWQGYWVRTHADDLALIIPKQTPQ
ncbi:MAG: family 10 glycosylhydrolase [Armatimonadota bacterium]|nr:family 10 glycosylhydrolase [Armatimonadota bacterium]